MTVVAKNEPAVVIVGSGAGGGTLAYELTRAGIPCVVLEAGPYLRNEDYKNDEWEAFRQMAWLDPRTTSGSWRSVERMVRTVSLLTRSWASVSSHTRRKTPSGPHTPNVWIRFCVRRKGTFSGVSRLRP